MSTVNFKAGTQSKLNKLSKGQNGTFYLTTDSNKLYVGKENGEVVLLNQDIIKVKRLKDIDTPQPHQFYYIEDENIFCLFNGEKWVQINTPTNDNTSSPSGINYKGTIGKGGNLDVTSAPSKDARAGDVYLVVGTTPIVAGDNLASAGKIIIAKEEAGAIIWEILPNNLISSPELIWGTF